MIWTCEKSLDKHNNSIHIINNKLKWLMNDTFSLISQAWSCIFTIWSICRSFSLPLRGWAVEEITVLCHFHKNHLMSLISILNSLTFYSLFHVSYCVQKCALVLILWYNSLCIILVKHISFLIHFISVSHCCPLVLIEDITQMWQGCLSYLTILHYKVL